MGGLIALEQPNIAGNYLSALRDQQQTQLQQQQSARADQLGQQQQIQFQEGQQDRQAGKDNQTREQLIGLMRAAKTPEDWARLQRVAVSQFNVPPQTAMQYKFENKDAYLAASSQAPQYAKMDRDQLVQDRAYNLDVQRANETARHNRSDEATAAGRFTNRPLSLPATEKLSEAGRTIQILKDTVGTFKDDFAGYGWGGNTAMSLGSVAPGTLGAPSEDSVTWWKEYQNNKNAVRHALFGGALTPNEQAQFDAADITPNMAPSIIKRNLQIQAKLAAQGVSRLGKSLAASGYNPSAINEASGLSLDEASRIGQTGQFQQDGPATQGGIQQEYQPGGPAVGTRLGATPPQAGAGPRMQLNGRAITVRNGGWVYEDTGEVAQ